jgi:hypothetical protein
MVDSSVYYYVTRQICHLSRGVPKNMSATLVVDRSYKNFPLSNK